VSWGAAVPEKNLGKLEQTSMKEEGRGRGEGEGNLVGNREAVDTKEKRNYRGRKGGESGRTPEE